MWYRWGRYHARLTVDLVWVVLTAFLALLIRDNFVLSVSRAQAILPYVALCVVSAALVFVAARIDRSLWRFVSLVDILHVIAVVTVALLLALLGGFVLNRLEGVARSLPVIQWLLLVGGMVGSRILVRLTAQRRRIGRGDLHEEVCPQEHVLLIGLGDLAELYLQSIAALAPKSLAVVGILAPNAELRGRYVRKHKILGAPNEVVEVLAQLEIHGVTVERIVVAQPFEHLSKDAQDALRQLERSSGIEFYWLTEALGLRHVQEEGVKPEAEGDLSSVPPDKPPTSNYHRLKRVIDGTAAAVIIIALSPVLLLIATLVAVDVGFPIVFWQQRPGRHRRPFKLYKFRTMRGAHDVECNRVPDELRSSRFGEFLRKSRLDELPQLYNILVGEMSFVGPRPLLPVDQPEGQALRLTIRPGLTGWAQIHGGRDISPDEKDALDRWYVTNASLWLDLRIAACTLDAIILNGRLSGMTLDAPLEAMEEAESDPSNLGKPGMARPSRMTTSGCAKEVT